MNRKQWKIKMPTDARLRASLVAAGLSSIIAAGAAHGQIPTELRVSEDMTLDVSQSAPGQMVIVSNWDGSQFLPDAPTLTVENEAVIDGMEGLFISEQIFDDEEEDPFSHGGMIQGERENDAGHVVVDDAELHANEFIVVGTGDGAVGSLTLDNGAHVESNERMRVGQFGAEGTLNIQGGSSLVTDRVNNLGRGIDDHVRGEDGRSETTAYINISEGSSLVNNDNDYWIGQRGGHAHITIEGGSEMRTTDGSIYLGAGQGGGVDGGPDGSAAWVTVTGEDSEFVSSDRIHVGRGVGGHAELEVLDGAFAGTESDEIIIGRGSINGHQTTGKAVVSGEGSTLHSDSWFQVGNSGGFGELHVDDGGRIVESAAGLTIARNTGSEGIITMDDASAEAGGLRIARDDDTQAILTMDNGSTFEVDGWVNIGEDGGAFAGVSVSNGSSIEITDSSEQFTIGSYATLGGSGGTLIGDVESDGRIAPSATFEVDENGDFVELAGDVGGLSIEGDYTQSSAALLDLVLDGAASYDYLAITGEADLAGTLDVNVLSSSMPGGGYTLLSATDGIDGTFDDVNLTGAPSGWEVVYDSNTVSLIPEPGSLALLGAGAGLMLMRRRK